MGASAMAAPWGPDLILNATPLPLLDDASTGCAARWPTLIAAYCSCNFLDHVPQEGWADGYAKYGEQLNAKRRSDSPVDRAVIPKRSSAPTRTPISSGKDHAMEQITGKNNPRHRRHRLGRGADRHGAPPRTATPSSARRGSRTPPSANRWRPRASTTISIDLASSRFDEVPDASTLVLNFRRRQGEWLRPRLCGEQPTVAANLMEHCKGAEAFSTARRPRCTSPTTTTRASRPIRSATAIARCRA